MEKFNTVKLKTLKTILSPHARKLSQATYSGDPHPAMFSHGKNVNIFIDKTVKSKLLFFFRCLAG
ncbi:MAG: hypothetical protein CMM44_02700 [Rhodospirillaceae bacterium]|nr:hypothetical protein [Rhodospirillaceae bacterium]